VGSRNFDDRSFRLNDEANLNVFSEELASEQIRLIDADIAKSTPHGTAEVAQPQIRAACQRTAGAVAAFAALGLQQDRLAGRARHGPRRGLRRGQQFDE
jgi:phosphatidylserine/phosphatidylglycerophosphate/cardiolipin synthase-like enzyme